MAEVTVGAFLKEKLGNMARWVTAEVGEENLSFDVVEFVDARREVEVVVLAEVLGSHSSTITHRDWQGLLAALHSESVLGESVTAQIAELLQAVRVREAMHDKFWRYMELFRSVVLSSNT